MSKVTYLTGRGKRTERIQVEPTVAEAEVAARLADFLEGEGYDMQSSPYLSLLARVRKAYRIEHPDPPAVA